MKKMIFAILPVLVFCASAHAEGNSVAELNKLIHDVDAFAVRITATDLSKVSQADESRDSVKKVADTGGSGGCKAIYDPLLSRYQPGIWIHAAE